MITVPKKFKPELVAMRKEIANRRKEEERWFEETCRKLGIEPDFNYESDTLFDYLNNDAKDAVKFK